MHLAAPDFEELESLILGEPLGGGVARRVFAYGLNPDSFVIKYEYADGQFQNVAEWDMWCNATEKTQPFMAPCHFISRNGRFLLQERCEPCPRHLLPDKLPAIFYDVHQGNVGLLDGKPVMMDYGSHAAFSMAGNLKRWRKLYYE